MSGACRSRFPLPAALAALAVLAVSPASAQVQKRVPTTSAPTAPAPTKPAPKTPEAAPAPSKPNLQKKPFPPIPKIGGQEIPSFTKAKGKAPIKPPGKPPSVGHAAQMAKAASAAKAAMAKAAASMSTSFKPNVPSAKPPMVPVAHSGARVQVPKRDSLVGKNKMNEQVPSCMDFDACINQGTSPEKCCASHLSGTSRHCGICAKAGCILRTDWCRRVDRSKPSDKDSYCNMCFDMADKEEEELAKRVVKPQAAGSNFYPPPPGKGTGKPGANAKPKPAVPKKKGFGPPNFAPPAKKGGFKPPFPFPGFPRHEM